MSNYFLQEAQKLWTNASIDGDFKKVLLKLELHEKIMETFHVGPYYYFVFDLISSEFKFMSESVKDVLGYDAHDIDAGFLLSKIHPQDRPIFLNNENTSSDFLNKLPIDKIAKYKFSFDYRILNGQGVYNRILQQSIVLQHDDSGKIGSTLIIHTDITNIKSDNKSKLSFIGLGAEPSYHDVAAKEFYLPSKELLSKREKEILQELMNGANSEEIAKKLFVSRYTVDTHRKNILAKTNTKNTPELINKIITEGLI